MDLEFVTAVTEDLAVISEMMKNLYASEGLTPSLHAPDALRELLENPSLGRCLLVKKSAAVVGYLVIAFGFSLEFGGRDAFVDELFLVPEARGHGVGKQMVQFALDFCRAEGIRSLHLEVSQNNTPAQRLYRGAGFRERHEGYDLLTYRDIIP